jgi:hypothetical protein
MDASVSRPNAGHAGSRRLRRMAFLRLWSRVIRPTRTPDAGMAGVEAGQSCRQ